MEPDIKLTVIDKNLVNAGRVIKRCYLGLIPLLFVVSFLTYLDRGSVSFGSLQFRSDLGLTASDYGTGSGIFYVGYAFFQIPSNLILMRVGAARWLPVLVFGFGMISASSAAMKTRAGFYLLRFFLGTFEAGCYPGIWYHLSTFFNAGELGYAYAASATATAVGQMVGAPLAAGLLMMDGLRGLRGWQWIYIMEGSLTMSYALVLFSFLAREPGVAWFLRPAERDWLARRQFTAHQHAHDANPSAGTRLAILRTWKIWYVAANWMLVQFSIATIIYFNPLIVDAMFQRGHGWGNPSAAKFPSVQARLKHEAKVALISSLLWVPVVIFMLLIAFSSKHFKERNLHCAIPLTVAGVAYMLVDTVLVKGGPIAVYAVLIVGASAVESIHGAIWSWPRTFLHGEGAGVGIALFNTFGAIGGFAGPFVVGRLVDLAGGYRTAMIVLGSINFANAVALFWFRPGAEQEVRTELDSVHEAGVGKEEFLERSAVGPIDM